MKRVYLISLVLLTMLLTLSNAMVGQAEAQVISYSCIVDMSGALSNGDRFSGHVERDPNGVVAGTVEFWTACESTTTCEDSTGALKGLCNAYCEAMNCAGDVPEASEVACERVRTNFFNKGGLRLPCEPCGDHFVGDADTMLCHRDGSVLADFWGTGSFNGMPGYTFWVHVGDATAPFVDYFQTRIWTPDGSAVVDIADYISSGDISVLPQY
jgi:hypothetical protein